MKAGGSSCGSPTVIATGALPIGKDSGVASFSNSASFAKDESGTSAKRPENTFNLDESKLRIFGQISGVIGRFHPRAAGKKKRRPKAPSRLKGIGGQAFIAFPLRLKTRPSIPNTRFTAQ